MIDFQVSPEKKANLRKLAEFLLANGEAIYKAGRFDMGQYIGKVREGLEGSDYPFLELDVKPSGAANFHRNECGTVGCAAGYGPVAGIGSELEISQTGWYFYVQDTFTGGNSEVYAWCFAAEWTQIDNTPYGAALRILKMLDDPIGLSKSLTEIGITESFDFGTDRRLYIHRLAKSDYIFKDVVNAKLDEWDYE